MLYGMSCRRRIIQKRIGPIPRVDVESVNHGWLCDKGRFNFESTNSDHRLTTPLIRDKDDQRQLLGRLGLCPGYRC